MDEYSDYHDDDDDDHPLAHLSSDVIARAAEDPARVRQLLSEGNPVTAAAIFAAIQYSNIETLKILLDTGASPNLRSDAVDSTRTELDQDPEARGGDPSFVFEDREWYAIEHAAHENPRDQEARNQQAAMMTLLLDYGAEIYATHRQRISLEEVLAYPGDKTGHERQAYVDEESKGEAVYGLRSVVHALLEEGACVHPILNHATIKLDMEHRDPQGRTLFLSTCRSAMGADAAIDSLVGDAMEWRKVWSSVLNPFATTDARPSLFDALRTRGANLESVDHRGKNALHNLLDSKDPHHSYRPPGIRRSLLYMLNHFPDLVNQPDNQGDRPLHKAMQRLRRYPIRYEWDENAELDTVVDDLLDFGADQHARDSRGNTALHYLADEGLAETLLGEQTRRCFRLLLSRGVDINACNQTGRSALELVLDEDGRRQERRQAEYAAVIQNRAMPLPTSEEVDGEVFGMFEGAGVRWTDPASDGSTLAHVVARHAGNPRGAAWTRMLLAKGVDPSIKDREGKTAADVAAAYGNDPVLGVLAGDIS